MTKIDYKPEYIKKILTEIFGISIKEFVGEKIVDNKANFLAWLQREYRAVIDGISHPTGVYIVFERSEDAEAFVARWA